MIPGIYTHQVNKGHRGTPILTKDTPHEKCLVLLR